MRKINMKAMNKKYLAAGALAAVLVIGTTVGATNAFATNNDIGEEKAKSIAMDHAGVTAEEATGITCYKDMDNGVFEYDVEFWVKNIEYDYEINVITGDIISYDSDVEKNTTQVQEETAVETSVEPVTEIVESESTQTTSYIGEDKAIEIALAHAGISEDEITFSRTEFDIERGVAEYEVEWYVGTMEYEYTIDATTGNILEYDVELDN